MLAAVEGQETVVKTLLEWGATVDQAQTLDLREFICC